ncbi:hypothetical protein EJ05DRAFT_400697 [Pseudovirgaria hyperparasitica]|uniref:BZIP domain-containing protein n=1 Tax=Pseudovirgaria hyperparasitica TaxID=470096 RepID=A0A6A6W6F4_9PEZI|nr:uncharacterized protein EJ05DRAFT_400697 [Pseudovirgaria hyperparasitica]KAF2757769.1 hypothetical protein EJ05DRAFT_400697 [Pseudovirgaria hyperparasitica]
MPESPKDPNGPSAQRIKKREVDRRCQRLARQRTKSRLATLEALVEDFQKNDESGRVASLMKQISDLTTDKERLVKTLRSVQSALDFNIEDEDQDAPQSPNAVLNHNENTVVVNMNGQTYPPVFPEHVNTHIDLSRRDSISTERTSRTNRRLSIATPDFVMKQSPRSDVSLPILNFPNAYGAVSTPEEDISPLTGQTMLRVLKPVYNVEKNAACSACAERTNIWRYTNEILLARPKEDPQTVASEDRQHEETPLLAVMHGWHEVERLGKLTPAWRLISSVDKVIFEGQLGAIERVATLRAIHTLMMYHIDPSWERVARLPTWYFLRPSQTLVHSYATDYFAWPGVRERFVFSEHNYCGNIFWQLFNKNLRILWPYEFRDCYTKNVQTGELQFSLDFRRRLEDINVWAMGSDFFERFPELRSDIPQWNSIPKQVEADGDGRVTEVGTAWNDESVAGEDGESSDENAVSNQQKWSHNHAVHDTRHANIRQTRYGDGSMTLNDIVNLERSLREYV